MKHGTLVLVRHGESRLNELNIFTGLIDIPLSKKGLDEAHQVADHCRQFDYDVAFTSHLERAHETLLVILSHQKKIGIFQHEKNRSYNHFSKSPEDFIRETFLIFTSTHLNERSYGDLQGLDKALASQQFGLKKVSRWRRGFKDRPPKGESLKDVFDKVIPYFQECIHPRIGQGQKVLIVAHGNTLRAIIKFLENIEDDQIPFLDLPTGRPLIYSCVNNKFMRVEGEYSFDRPLR
ncbi:MAG: 2,3-bisphosphoglycerate-dependent phosphoglycerate mutase [Candidatus Magasanikbacteria bacterium]|nr:2,3-bisphosphoglycerate-dependent phosphoglycerate mutase [Candidatus Magasanikbacteria bacterium]